MKAESDLGAALDRLADVTFTSAVDRTHRRGGPTWIMGRSPDSRHPGCRRTHHSQMDRGSERGWKGDRSAYRIVMFGLIVVFCDEAQRPLVIEAGFAVMVITYI